MNYEAPEVKNMIVKMAEEKLAMFDEHCIKLAKLVYLDTLEPGTKLAASDLDQVSTTGLPAAVSAALFMNKVASGEVGLNEAAAFANATK